MDVLNKLRSTVSSTVSSLSGVLPGNPVTREFEATTHICSAGPGLLWKVYSGYKKSTKQEASIFVFEKKLLEKWPRESRETILESLKRGVAQMTRLRHPQVLTVQHPVEESRDSLAFATEPVFASLANVLGNHDNMPATLPASFQDFKLYELERKYGLLQVAEGLAFLHGDVKLLHNNLCPESIVINQQGAWKISGLGFCIHNETKSDGSNNWKSPEYSPYTAHVAQPSLDFMAPEAALANTRTPACDMFSLGALIYAIYHDGTPPVAHHNELTAYKSRIDELRKLSSMKFSKIPDGLRETAKMLLNFTPELRPDAHQFKKIEYFEDVGVKTLNYLDALFQWDKLQKSQFYKGLPAIIQNFPHRVNVHRVVPSLGKEFANPAMVPFVLPVVLQVAEKSSRDEYLTHIFPYLRVAMKLTEPIQILLIFMQKMELLLKMTPPDEVKSDVLPMFYRALDSDAQQIQELCLSVLPTYATLIDYPSMKNALLPRVKKLCINTSFLSVRVNCLVCLGKLLDHLDKWLVLDDILPFLQQIPSREPAVLMGILGICKIALNHEKLGIPKEVIATKVIPFLMPMTIENGLTLAQFNTLFSVVKDMVNRVESEHRGKIEQLNAINNATNTLSSPVVADVASATKVDMESIFSSDVPVQAAKVGNGLSMDEKQRMMRQQETAERIGRTAHSTLVPSPATTIKPKDQASSLLEANLANLAISKPAQAPPMNIFPQGNVVQNAAMSFGAPPVQRPAFNWSQTPSLPMGSMGMNQPRPAFAMNHPPMYNTSNFSMTAAMKPQAPATKPLSSSEINDLLS